MKEVERINLSFNMDNEKDKRIIEVLDRHYSRSNMVKEILYAYAQGIVLTSNVSNVNIMPNEVNTEEIVAKEIIEETEVFEEIVGLDDIEF